MDICGKRCVLYPHVIADVSYRYPNMDHIFTTCHIDSIEMAGSIARRRLPGLDNMVVSYNTEPNIDPRILFGMETFRKGPLIVGNPHTWRMLGSHCGLPLNQNPKHEMT